MVAAVGGAADDTRNRLHGSLPSGLHPGFGPSRIHRQPAKLQIMNKLLLVILCFLLPPLAVYLKTNNVKTTLLNLVLCIFFYVPGLIHALYVVLT
jgi:uncharacterized membrane protein YqaE (UPF0057 family)